MITLYARDTDSGCGNLGHTLRYDKGISIYYEGDPARYWYEVVSGIVRTCRFHGDGHRQLTGLFYTDDVFGMGEDNYAESAESVTSVTLRRHHRQSAIDKTGNNEAAAGLPEAALQRAFQTAQQCIFLLGHRTAAERVAAFLIAVNDRRNDSGSLLLLMTRADIADYLGLTIHTVSRTISDLARRKLITLDGPQRIRIIDTNGLRVLAGEIALPPEPPAIGKWGFLAADPQVCGAAGPEICEPA